MLSMPRSARGDHPSGRSRRSAVAAVARSSERLSAILQPLARNGTLQKAGLCAHTSDFASEVAQTAALVAFAAELLPNAKERPVLHELSALSHSRTRVKAALYELTSLAQQAAAAPAALEPGVQPIDAFYEQLLDELDPSTRRACGVYFTPAPVVSFIVRAVHRLLQERLGLADGLADTTTWGELCARDARIRLPAGTSTDTPFVHVLDPACGTGAFLLAAIDCMHDALPGKRWDRFVRDHLLARLEGIDILAAPAVIARMAIASRLRETGFAPESLEVIRVRTADALAPETWRAPQRRVTVILGNPPFAGAAPAASPWMANLMLDYKRSVRTQERQLQRLSNQYVRFLRLADWLVHEAGVGAIGWITDRGWLDGLLFGDVRRSILGMAERVHVVDLGGGSARRPAEPSDANVFAIRQPVAIACGVLRPGIERAGDVRTARISGSRDEKLAWLASHGIDAAAFARVIRHRSGRDYERWASLLDIIGTGDRKRDRALWFGTGFKTRHDGFVVGMTPEHAVEQVQRLAHRKESDDALREELHLCTTVHFDLAAAREQAERPRKELLAMVRRVAWRPFDWRYIVWSRAFVCEPKERTMRHLLHEGNLALAVLRRDRTGLGCGAFVARGLVAKDLVSNVDDALVWPLYVDTGTGLQPNLQEKFLDALSKLGSFEARDVLGYLYAVLWSPHYRDTYRQARCADFPRIPMPRSAEMFQALAGIGLRLCTTHLLEQAEVPAEAHVRAGTVVQEVRFDRGSGRAFIGRDAWFSVPAAAWDYVVGAHAVCSAWLAARRGWRLSGQEVQQFVHVVAAAKAAGALVLEVDECIERHGGWNEAFGVGRGRVDPS
jgi:hypothetical protein